MAKMNVRVLKQILRCCKLILRLTKGKKPKKRKNSKPHQTAGSTSISNCDKMKHSELSLSGKKGICFTLGGKNTEKTLARVKQLNTSWNYSWNVQRNDGQPSDVEFVPQVWGGAKDEAAMWKRLEQKVVPQIEAGQCKRILAFNEPDMKKQSNMTVEKSLELWPQLEKLGVPICSPSCANPLGCSKAEDSCQGVHGSWMLQFMHELEERGYRCDYLGVHWYGNPSFPAFKRRMREIYDSQGGKYPLMITEFAVADWKAMNKSCGDNRFSQRQVLDFMKKALPWMEKQNWIAAYAWFPFKASCSQGTCSALFDDDDKPTALGRYYATVTPENPEGNQSITA